MEIHILIIIDGWLRGIYHHRNQRKGTFNTSKRCSDFPSPLGSSSDWFRSVPKQSEEEPVGGETHWGWKRLATGEVGKGQLRESCSGVSISRVVSSKQSQRKCRVIILICISQTLEKLNVPYKEFDPQKCLAFCIWTWACNSSCPVKRFGAKAPQTWAWARDSLRVCWLLTHYANRDASFWKMKMEKKWGFVLFFFLTL